MAKSSSTFSATNIISYIRWLFQLHDTIQFKSNYTRINYNHDNMDIRIYIMIYDSVYNIFLVPNLVAYISQKEKKLGHLLICSVRKMVLVCLMQSIIMCLREWSRSGGSYGNNTQVICCPASGVGMSPPSSGVMKLVKRYCAITYDKTSHFPYLRTWEGSNWTSRCIRRHGYQI